MAEEDRGGGEGEEAAATGQEGTEIAGREAAGRPGRGDGGGEEGPPRRRWKRTVVEKAPQKSW